MPAMIKRTLKSWPTAETFIEMFEAKDKTSIQNETLFELEGFYLQLKFWA
jgi:hypothetical protein